MTMESNRRTVLGGLAVAVLAGFPGCGYAYGGGDLRDEASAPGVGGDPGLFFEAEDGTIAVGGSGLTWTRTGPDGRLEYTAATRVSKLAIEPTDSTGSTASDGPEEVWRFVYDTAGDAIALGDRAYVLLEDEAVVASEPVEPDDNRAWSREPATAVGWTAAISGAAPPLAADEWGAYVPTADAIHGVRDGDTRWSKPIPDPIEALSVMAGIVLGVTATTVVGLEAASGEPLWTLETDGPAAIDGRGGELAVRTGRDVHLLAADSGSTRWVTGIGTAAGGVAVTDGGVYATGDALVALDPDDGDARWTVDRVIGEHATVVEAPEGPYIAIRGGTILAVDGDDGRERWARRMDVEDAVPLFGWLDGETVAFLFDSGDVVWFQRVDEEPGLFR